MGAFKQWMFEEQAREWREREIEHKRERCDVCHGEFDLETCDAYRHQLEKND